jgi:pimeloyl-ACP methyl ester carboxylesterase
MRYLKAGTGPPIILLHGLLGYSFSWRFTIPALVNHATVYAIDNLGFGLSACRGGMDCGLLTTAEHVLQFAEALGITNFDLLGTSYGGAVAIIAAARGLDRAAEGAGKAAAEGNGNSSHSQTGSETKVGRLILVGPVNPWSAHGRRLAPFLGSDFGALLIRNTLERFRHFDEAWLRRLFGDATKIPPDSLEGYLLPVLKNGAMLHGGRVLKTWTSDIAAVEKALPKLRDCPTLLIWGTKDRAVDYRSAEPLRRNFRNARLVTLEGVGHVPYEEAPEEFNRAVIDFLKDTASI